MKYIMITGASSGIGEETARLLARQEDVTTILVARNEEKLKKLVNEFGGETKYLVYDLTDVWHIESCFIKCREWGIKLDGLIHCAGIGENMPIRLIQTEHIKKMYQIHPMAFIELGKYFSKRKYSNDGSSIVVMSSMAAYEMEKGMAAYASSKAAVNTVVKVMAKEMADRRIRVNGVAPAFVATPMIKEDMDMWEKEGNSPQKFGVIPPKQVAGLIGFLMSEQAAYITGEIISISAGMIY